MKATIALLLAAIVGFGFFSCSTKSSDSAATGTPSGQGYTYSSTSNVGDYAEWSFTGSTMTATWQHISASGTVQKTYNVTANCPTFNTTYGYFTCNIDTAVSTCTPGTQACTGNPSGTFDMMEVPGVALFVHTNDGTDQLHVGLLKDSNACSINVAGTYVYSRTGLGLRDLYGMYVTDSNFLSVTHADFGMVAASSSATPQVTYLTQDVSGAGTVTFGNGGCTGGVRTRTLNGQTFRTMMTANGLFVLDMPQGQGGLVSFKAANAATLADFANKNFGGISFPDNGAAQPIAATMGAVSGTMVPITSVLVGGTSQTGLSVRSPDATSAATNPSFPNFTLAPTSGTFSYNANTAIQPTYPTPSVVPGLFKIDGTFGDSGRVLLMAAKLNSKIVAFGTVYNWRTNGQTNPSTGNPFSPDGLYNTGSFLLFEK